MFSMINVMWSLVYGSTTPFQKVLSPLSISSPRYPATLVADLRIQDRENEKFQVMKAICTYNVHISKQRRFRFRGNVPVAGEQQPEPITIMTTISLLSLSHAEQ